MEDGKPPSSQCGHLFPRSFGILPLLVDRDAFQRSSSKQDQVSLCSMCSVFAEMNVADLFERPSPSAARLPVLVCSPGVSTMAEALA